MCSCPYVQASIFTRVGNWSRSSCVLMFFARPSILKNRTSEPSSLMWQAFGTVPLSSYLEAMQNIVFSLILYFPQGYIHEARNKEDLFDKDSISLIFSNVEEILDFQSSLLEQMESRFSSSDPAATLLGSIFVDNVSKSCLI